MQKNYFEYKFFSNDIRNKSQNYHFQLVLNTKHNNYTANVWGPTKDKLRFLLVKTGAKNIIHLRPKNVCQNNKPMSVVSAESIFFSTQLVY